MWFTEHCGGVNKIGNIDTANTGTIHEYALTGSDYG